VVRVVKEALGRQRSDFERDLAKKAAEWQRGFSELKASQAASRPGGI
jgi:anti-sigma-K factor RskA